MRKIRKKVSFPDGKRHLFVYVLTDLKFFKFFLYLKKHWINADEQKQKDGITEGTHQKVPGGILLKKISENSFQCSVANQICHSTANSSENDQ